MDAWGEGEVSAKNPQKMVHCLKENAVNGDLKVIHLYYVVICNALDSIDSILKRRAVWLGILHSQRLALLLFFSWGRQIPPFLDNSCIIRSLQST